MINSIIPAVKERTIKQGSLTFSGLNCHASQEIFEFVQTFIGYFSSVKVNLCEKENANFIALRNEEIQDQAYAIKVEDAIIVEYSSLEGVRNALATLLQIMDKEGESFSVCRQYINDCPDGKFRSVLLDLGRGVPTMERLEQDLKRFALAKCNVLHLHLMDSQGIGYESKVVESRLLRGTKPYTMDELVYIVNFAKSLGMEALPELEFPAHSEYLMPQYQHLQCPVEVENKSPWTVCLGNEETYELFERLIAELAEIFPYQYLHIGTDEHYFNDIPKINSYCYWDICPVCQAKMKEQGLNTTTELFYYSVARLQAVAKKHGKQILLWNDEIDIAKDVNISRDCIVQYWRIANENRGPRKGCTFKKFLEKDFSVIVSPFEQTYVDLEDYANPEKVSVFNFKQYGDAEEYADKIIGAEACVWEYANPEYTHYKYSLPSSATLLLAKFWNTNSVFYDMEYRRALTKMIFGEQTPKNYDLFELFGSIMPPRISGTISYGNDNNGLIDDEILQKHLEFLTKIKSTYSSLFLEDVLKFVNDSIKK